MMLHQENIQTDSDLHLYQYPEKVKFIDVDGVPPSADIMFLLPSVAEVILVVGATVSVVQAYSAGDGSSCPELSAALTLNVCGPSPNKLGNVNGLVQAAKSELSILHSK